MTFSTKANSEAVMQQSSGTGGGSQATDAQWQDWNTYYFGLIDASEKQATRKDGSVVEGKVVKKVAATGILNFIVDVGTQPQPDSSYDSKVAPPQNGEENSAEELEHIKKYPNNYYFWEDGKRRQGKPERPRQEYLFGYDFPEIMVDWTKHPIEDLHKLGTKPLRVTYNGSFTQGGAIHFGKTLRFDPHWQTGKISANSPLYKIADKSRLATEFEESGYDLGVLVQSACKWDLSMSRTEKDGKTYYNTDIKNPTEITEVKAGGMTITVEQQIPECDVPFTGVLMNGGEYPDDAMDMVLSKRELMAVLPRAVQFQPNAQKAADFWLGTAFEGSDLQKALEARKGEQVGGGSGNPSSQDPQQPQSEGVGQTPSGQAKQAETTREEPVQKAQNQYNEPPLDFSDEIPF